MERWSWSHPDITLPQLLSIIRAFIDMLILASGYQPSGSPALWRTDDVQRALGWASLLEEIMRKIPVSMKGKESREALDAALQEMMVNETFPLGIPRLSCIGLAEARKLLIFTMSNALGSCSGQLESLLAAVHNEQKDWEAVLRHVSDRCLGISSTQSLCDALELSTFHLNRIGGGKNSNKCCQQWRQNSLAYVLDKKTLYKLSGATVIFKSSESQWRNILDTIQCNADKRKEIAKHGVEAYLLETIKGKEEVLWSLSPILVAAALKKGSCLLSGYISELFKHMDIGESPSRYTSNSGEGYQENSGAIFERVWSLQFQEQITCISTV